jgi:hypothetical protein
MELVNVNTVIISRNYLLIRGLHIYTPILNQNTIFMALAK